MRPPTTFDQPQFSLLPDDEWRHYGNVDNLAAITDGGATVAMVNVVVPTALFSLMKDALKIPQKTRVSLYFDAYEDHVVFGLTDGVEPFDLWSYPRGAAPSFVQSHLPR